MPSFYIGTIFLILYFVTMFTAGEIGIVTCDQRQMIRYRGRWDPNFIVINQFKSKEEFEAAYYCGEKELNVWS